MAYNSKYTGAQVEAQLDKVDGKQDIISDLATIRSGAALGATALQTETYKGTVTGIKMNGASKGTSGVVDLGTVITAHQDISGKQDKLTSGSNIKTINNTSILGSGNLSIPSYDDTELRNKITKLEGDIESSKQGMAYVSGNKLVFRAGTSARVEGNKLIL